MNKWSFWRTLPLANPFVNWRENGCDLRNRNWRFDLKIVYTCKCAMKEDSSSEDEGEEEEEEEEEKKKEGEEQKKEGEG